MVMKKITNVIFDLDGTIIDPKVGITNSFKYAFKQYDLDVEDTTIATYIGPPLVDTFREYHLNVDEAVAHFRTYFTKQGIREFVLYAGIEEMLSGLKELGYTLAVATSKPTVYAKDILESKGLTNYFKCIEGSNLDNTRTDKSEILEAVLEQLTGDSVMVGDRKHDIIGAKKQQLMSVGVLYGYGSKEELEDSGATYIISKPIELLSLMQGKV